MQRLKFALLLIVFLIPLRTWAVSIVATIVDDKTNAPIKEAYVYLDGTSFMTITDSEGRFELNVPKNISATLIVRHISYGRQNFQWPFESIPRVIKMSQKTYVLDEVTVMSIDRSELLEFFHKCFFGEHIVANMCVMNNPDVLRFKFQDKGYSLSVTTGDDWLHVTNHHLGYEVYFMINENFTGLPKKMNLSLGLAYQYGDFETRFVDVSNGAPKYEKRRHAAFMASKTAFWKSISSEPISESDFIIKRQRSGPAIKNNKELGWVITDTLDMKKVTIPGKGRMSGEHQYASNYSNKPLYDQFWVAHKSVATNPTLFRLFEREFYVDKYGNYIFPGRRPRYSGVATAYGFMNRLGAANQLPKDYMP